MRIQPLHDLQQEINRLFIAGARFAKDDPRLLKTAAVLDPLGKKAPVFKKLADSARELAASDSRSAADKLSGLGVLLYSVLYTQGESLAPGGETSQQIPPFRLDQVDTSRSFAELARIRELATAKPGRLETIQEAFLDGVFTDFRTFPVLDSLLGDRYAELAEYVAGTVMPAAGKAIIPFLVRNFRYENTMEMVRRFRVLQTLDAPQLPEMVEKILAGSLPDLQVEAIPYLGKSIDNEEMLLQLAGDRNKKVRAAAYLGLARLATPKALDKLLGIFEDPKRGLKHDQAAFAAARIATESPETATRVLAVIKPSYENIAVLGEKTGVIDNLIAKLGLAGDKNGKKATLAISYKDLNERFADLATDLPALQRKECGATYDFLAGMLADERFLRFVRRYAGKPENTQEGKLFARRITTELIEAMAAILSTLDAGKALAFYEGAITGLDGPEWHPLWRGYFLTAAARRTPETLLARFAPAIRNGNVSGEDIAAVLTGGGRTLHWHEPLGAAGELAVNPRWTDALYESCLKHPKHHGCLQALWLLHRIEPGESERFNRLLAALPASGDTRERDLFRIRAVAAREHPERYELVHRMIAANPDLSQTGFLDELGDFWRSHPAAYQEKYREFAARKKNKHGFALILRRMQGEEE